MAFVSVRVPGSTSNCGAGFDTLGLALQVYNTVQLESMDGSVAVPVTARDGRAESLVAEAMAHFEARSGRRVGGFRYRIDGDVPLARGLGSSVTVLAGVMAGINHLAGEPLTRLEMAAAITAIEGHPDNATAGVLGGFCISRCGATPAEFVDLVRIELPDTLRFVVVSPAVEVATKASRGVLPTQISHLDAVRSVNSAAYLTAALATGDFSKLRGAVGDFLHEPYRLPGIKGAREAIDAGIAAGAFTGWLSGSGSSVLCVADAMTATAAGEAMREAFNAVGIDSEIRDLAADNAGLTVTKTS